MKIDYFIMFDYNYLRISLNIYTLLSSHNLLNKKLKKRMKNVDNRDKSMEIKESTKIEAIKKRTFSLFPLIVDLQNESKSII